MACLDTRIMTEYETVSTELFDKDYKPYLTEVSSQALGGRVLACSDEFFARKDHLIKPAHSKSLKGQFGPQGALYDGWESRRHNPSFDWVIIRLAPDASNLTYFDIDTSHFSGNEAPASQVFAMVLDKTDISQGYALKLSSSDTRWIEVLPVVELGPNSRHIFKAGSKAREGSWGALIVRMIPDGGMARFRAYGNPIPPKLYETIPPPETEPINLLSALTGARVISCSDANFSPPGNLLLPGRGHDMSDGWETRRSQIGRGKYAKGGALEGKERKEWVVIKMNCTGVIRWAEVDTAFHPGNYPVACRIEAAFSDAEVPDESQWTTIIAKKPLGPHRQHWLDVERIIDQSSVFSHIRLSIYPDGGLKRLRLYGYPLGPRASPITSGLTIPALPLTPEAFAPYGQVIQGFSLPSSAPKGIHTTTANQGTATKFHRMAKIEETYTNGQLTKGGLYIACTHAEKQADTKDGLRQPIKMLERHNFTTQAFIPMGKDTIDEEALGPGGAHLVIVALNGKDDEPDLGTIRAFLATASQGISYNAGTWHHSLFTLDGPLNYALVEAQIGDGSKADCDFRLPSQPYGHVIIPPYTAVSPVPPVQDSDLGVVNKISALASALTLTGKAPLIPEPISRAAFAPYGQIIRMYPDPASRPAECDFQPAPHGLTQKYARLADIAQSYTAGSGAQTAISVYRATPKVGLERGKEFGVKVLERHSYTTQAFVPMGKGEWAGKSEAALPPGGEMLVIVALNGPDDRPDASTLMAFRCPSSIGISYQQGIWHHPVLVLDQTMDLACIETQISTGVPERDERDCEVIEVEAPWGIVAVPA